ncbi:MAG: hypothetical protein ACRYF9_26715 [Janthinobacterium lividum]
MSGAQILKVSLEALSHDGAPAAILHADNIRINPFSSIAVQLISGKPLACQANSEASSALSEGLEFLLHAM